MHPYPPAFKNGQSLIIVKLPFLKNKTWPRIAKPIEEKMVNGSADDHLEFHCAGELMDAVETKDVSKFRSALEALVMNMFEHEESDNG